MTLQAPVAWQPSLSLPPAGELTTALCTFITNGQEIDPMDQETLAHYMPHMADRPAGQTLADIILAKLEAGAEADAAEDEGTGAKGKGKGVRFEQVGDGRDPAAGLPAKVVEAYTKIGELLSRYKSGPLPKPFKLLPSLPQWARLLALTSPADWSPHATFAATKIFVSNLKPRQATIFLRGILLERVRDDMRENGGKLNYQLYEALKKSLYKPAAFFKGILFPLCDVRPLPVCPASLNTLAPKLISPFTPCFSAVGLHAQGGCDSFLRPLQVVGPDGPLWRGHRSPGRHGLHRPPLALYPRPSRQEVRAAVQGRRRPRLPLHSVRPSPSRCPLSVDRSRADVDTCPPSRLANDKKSGLKGEGHKLPVLWHQSLLVFAQRYASDLTPDQKDALLDVIRLRPHPQISPEIRRELVGGVVRGEPRPEEMEIDNA